MKIKETARAIGIYDEVPFEYKFEEEIIKKYSAKEDTKTALTSWAIALGIAAIVLAILSLAMEQLLFVLIMIATIVSCIICANFSCRTCPSLVLDFYLITTDVFGEYITQLQNYVTSKKLQAVDSYNQKKGAYKQSILNTGRADYFEEQKIQSLEDDINRYKNLLFDIAQLQQLREQFMSSNKSDKMHAKERLENSSNWYFVLDIQKVRE